MNIENTFYTLAIIYMIFGILMLTAVTILSYFIFKKITKLVHVVEEKIDQIKHFADNPQETAYAIGAQIAKKAFKGSTKK